MDMSLSKFQEIVKDGEACLAIVYGVAKSRTQLSDNSKSEVLELAQIASSISNIFLFLLLFSLKEEGIIGYLHL